MWKGFKKITKEEAYHHYDGGMEVFKLDYEGIESLITDRCEIELCETLVIEDKEVKPVRIDVTSYDVEPERFHAMDCFQVFVDKNLGETVEESMVECANIYRDEQGSLTEFDIIDIETYGGHGAHIINFLMNDNKYVNITGSALKESKGFWEKMGAEFGRTSEGGEDFIIIKPTFQKTKYYRGL